MRERKQGGKLTESLILKKKKKPPEKGRKDGLGD